MQLIKDQYPETIRSSRNLTSNIPNNPVKKAAKEINRHFSKDKNQMAN